MLVCVGTLQGRVHLLRFWGMQPCTLFSAFFLGQFWPEIETNLHNHWIQPLWRIAQEEIDRKCTHCALLHGWKSLDPLILTHSSRWGQGRLGPLQPEDPNQGRCIPTALHPSCGALWLSSPSLCSFNWKEYSMGFKEGERRKNIFAFVIFCYLTLISYCVKLCVTLKAQ